VESFRMAGEIVRALVALGALIAWGGVCLLLGG
jgi:hypothetical protein